jgi:hypothetical protein
MCGDQQNQGKIVGLGTGKEFGDSISDMEDLFPVKPSRTEIHTNIISGIDDDETSNLASPSNIEQDSFY